MNINISCCIQLLCGTDFRTGILVPGFKSDFTPSLLCAGRKSEHSEKSGPLNQNRQDWYTMANLPFEMTFLAGSAAPGNASHLPVVIKSIRAPARSLH